MTSNPLLSLLVYLNRKEMTKFREFVNSPYFNKHKDVRTLVTYLSKVHPNFTEKKCARKVIFKVIFPNEKHNQAKLALVFTYAYRLLEKFIHVEDAMADGSIKAPHRMIRFVRERDVLFLLEKKWKEIIKGVNNDYIIDQSSKIEWFAEMDAYAMKMGKLDRDFLIEKQQCLDRQYLNEKIKDACELVTRGRYHKKPIEPLTLLDSVVAEIERRASYGSKENLERLLFLNCFRLMKSGDSKLYADFHDLVNTHASDLAEPALQSIYNYLQNFCIWQINQGNSEFLRHLFDIYQSQLSRNLLLENGRLPEWHYKNIVTTGLRLDEHQWVRQFLENYRPLLDPTEADNAYSYNLAAYYYHLHNYEEVLRLLVQVEYTDLRYNLDAKAILLKTYYDLEEEEPLLALCQAFRQFLKRNKALTEFQKKGYINLLKFTRKSFKLKMNKGFVKKEKWIQDLHKLSTVVSGAETVFNKTWLEEKIKEMDESRISN